MPIPPRPSSLRTSYPATTGNGAAARSVQRRSCVPPAARPLAGHAGRRYWAGGSLLLLRRSARGLVCPRSGSWTASGPEMDDLSAAHCAGVGPGAAGGVDGSARPGTVEALGADPLCRRAESGDRRPVSAIARLGLWTLLARHMD